MISFLKSALVVSCIALISSTSAQTPGPGANAPTLALKGFDPVAYFTDGRPVKGSPGFQHDWDDARYRFSSAQHRAAFVADPERYAPQFGALCATGLSIGKQITADPTIWKIVDGKLYVFSSAKAREMADKDPALLERSRQSQLNKK